MAINSAPAPTATLTDAPRLLAPDERRAAAEALGRAFFDDPLLEYLMPDDGKRSRVMTPLMLCAVQMAYPEGHCYTTSTGPLGAALFMPPGKPKVPMSRLARVVLPQVPRFGVAPLLRYMGVMDELEKKHPRTPHWYLATLGVDPEHQGQGLGGHLISAILQRADADRTPVYLETNKARNVPFYEKHGFQVVEHFNCHAGKGPETWTMLRNP